MWLNESRAQNQACDFNRMVVPHAPNAFEVMGVACVNCFSKSIRDLPISSSPDCLAWAIPDAL